MRVKFRNRLFTKVFLLFASMVFLIVLFYGFMVIPLQKQSLQQIMYTQALTVARSIVQASSDAMISKDFGFIVEHNVKVLQNNASIRYVLISAKRGEKIWVDSSGWQMLNSLDEFFTSTETPEIRFRIHALPKQATEYHFVYPVQFSGIEWGWLHIGFSMDEYNQYIHNMYLQVLYISSISLILIMLLGYMFARWITEPITFFSALASKVANGNLEVESTVKRSDEIGMLSENFNSMVSSLRLSKQHMQNYNQELEQEVKRRTEQLDQLNQNLDLKIKEEVSQRREQERLLIHQSRLAAMGEMIGAIAHQWRQPLNALGLVYQNTFMLYKTHKLDDELMTRNTEKAERLINKMSSTIDDFRNFFKPNKHAEDFSVNQMIHSIMDLLEAVLKNHNITTVLDCEEASIKGLQGELSQVVLNLLNNAKDALIEKRIPNPEIKVEVKRKPNNILLISVSDNAGGIPDEIMDKIYDPYFTTKEAGKGTGIGLYMSKIIVESNMQGKLQAKNNGKGATFTVTIPG